MNTSPISPAANRIDQLMSEYTDSVLVQRFLRGFAPSKKGSRMLCEYVMSAFGCGCTVATHICKRHGYDPHIAVKRRTF